MSIFRLLALACFVAIFSGCGGAKKCNNNDVKDVLLGIIEGDVRKAAWGREILDKGYLTDLKIKSVKTESRDRDSGSYQCSATLAYKYRDHDDTYDITYKTSYLEDEKDTEVGLYDAAGIKARIMAMAIAYQ